MNHVEVRIGAAAVLVWLGMVLAISFMEAPLKFRTPGLDLRTGLAIGRIVFRALNSVELLWAVVLAVCLTLQPQSTTISTLAAVAVAVLLVQLAVVRPWLARRSDRVLSGERDATAPRSRSHLLYVALEVVKAAVLVALACYLLAA